MKRRLSVLIQEQTMFSRTIWRSRTARSIALLYATLVIPLPAKEPKVSNLATFPRVAFPWVALLVCRMGSPDGVLKDVLPETDYATKTASAKQSLWAEDEARLREAFPQYPRMGGFKFQVQQALVH